MNELIQIGEGPKAFTHRRLPDHCVRPQQRTPRIAGIERMLRGRGLHSVCEEARCPNRSECWSAGHVTFMLLGSVCTRACRFCAVTTGLPANAPDPREPAQVAAAAAELALRHVVLTSVNRDDLPDGGANQFAATVCALRAASAETTVEVLTPDFQGNRSSVDSVCSSHPDVYNHNVETIPRLYRAVRPGARFERSLEVLSFARRARPGAIVKSGLMVGLGENADEVVGVLESLKSAGVDSVTIGQYLRPTRHHLPVERYWDPEEFDALADTARGLGFTHVASGPLVRSSYHAGDAFAQMRGALPPAPLVGAESRGG